MRKSRIVEVELPGGEALVCERSAALERSLTLFGESVSRLFPPLTPAEEALGKTAAAELMEQRAAGKSAAYQAACLEHFGSIAEAVCDWRGVVGDDGAALPFDRAALGWMLDVGEKLLLITALVNDMAGGPVTQAEEALAAVDPPGTSGSTS